MDPAKRPSARAIRILRMEVYANLSHVRSTLGGGDHGHLGMVMPHGEYIVISAGGAAYVAPPVPQIPAFNGTAAAVAAQNAQYLQDLKEYEQYQELHQQIKALMLQAIPEIYLAVLRHPQLKFANATPRQIMTHLLTTYGEITENDLAENTKLFKAAWNPDTPIETVFDNGTFCRDFAEEGGDPISDQTYTRTLVEIFEKAGAGMDQAVEDWEKKPRADKTLANVIPHFTEANEHRLRKLAKGSKEVLEANTVTKEESPTTSNVEALIAETKALVEKANKTNTTTTGKREGNGKGLERFSYCWSHGVCQHPGSECRNPKEGHKPEATVFNRKGGAECLTIFSGSGRTGKQKKTGDEENTTPN
jgi:hypothetical protein